MKTIGHGTSGVKNRLQRVEDTILYTRQLVTKTGRGRLGKAQIDAAVGLMVIALDEQRAIVGELRESASEETRVHPGGNGSRRPVGVGDELALGVGR